VCSAHAKLNNQAEWINVNGAIGTTIKAIPLQTEMEYNDTEASCKVSQIRERMTESTIRADNAGRREIRDGY